MDFRFFWIILLQAIHFNFSLLQPPKCITATKLTNAVKILCANRDNATLWQKAIDCHHPISEQLMRLSGQANVPFIKVVPDPWNADHTIEEVFFNVCGSLEGNSTIKNLMFYNFENGMTIGAVTIPSSSDLKCLVQNTYGKDTLCNIGKCILNMGLNL